LIIFKTISPVVLHAAHGRADTLGNSRQCPQIPPMLARNALTEVSLLWYYLRACSQLVEQNPRSKEVLSDVP
jgi:hypothetical protein